MAADMLKKNDLMRQLMRGRERVGLHELPLAAAADLVDNHEENEKDNKEWCEGDPRRDGDVIAANGNGGCRVGGAEDGDKIAADFDILGQAHRTEKGDHVAADCRTVGSGHVAEEGHDVALHSAVNPGVAKEDDDIAGGLALKVNAAEEADGVTYGLIGCDIDVVEELDGILIGAGVGGRGCQGRAKKAKCEKSPDHRRAILAQNHYTRAVTEKFPGDPKAGSLLKTQNAW